MRIPFGDQHREVEEIREAIGSAIERVLVSGRFILGPEVEAFEQAFADWLGVPYVVGVASGTEAITLALKALGIGSGDEVITVANTCIPTAVGIMGSGASIRLADCHPDTLLISTESAAAAVTPRTRAIVPVHLYGNSANMAQLQKLADQNGLSIVEDCAHAVGGRIFDKPTGTFGETGAFSFYPTKNLGAYGDGGCIVTASPEVHKRLCALRNYGYTEQNYSSELGINSRLDPIQAAILTAKLQYLDGWNHRRAEIASRYRSTLEELGIHLPSIPDSVNHAYHLFVMLVQNRERVRSRLQEFGIQTLVHYPLPLHLQPALASLGYKPGDFPKAEWACSQVLSLPIFPQLRDDEVNRIIEVLSLVIREGESGGSE